MDDYNIILGRNIKATQRYIEVINPATEEKIARFPDADTILVDEAMALARKTQKQWGKTSFKERKEVLRTIASGLLESVKTLAELETREIGKCFKESLFVDVPLGAECFTYYASFLDTLTLPQERQADTLDMVEYVPYGVAGIYLPYNVPLMIFGFTASAAIAAGNTVIVKPSEYASLSMLECANIFQKLDIPEGLITVVTGRGETVGKHLAATDVDIISFTGSERTVKDIISASVAHPKKIISELGGCNLSVIFSDANVEEAAQNLLGSAFIKQGQMCIGTSVALIHEDAYGRVLAILKDKLQKIKVGNPFDSAVGIGPLPSKQRVEDLDRRVQQMIKSGAKCLCGGKRLSGKGFFYAPTILEIQDMCYAEFFAPVLLVKSFKNDDELRSLVQNNPTGLVAQIWTEDLRKAQAWSRQIDAGTVWVNSFAQMSPGMPFGGIKRSGWGTSLGMYGFLEYSHMKHIGINFVKSKVSGWFGV